MKLKWRFKLQLNLNLQLQILQLQFLSCTIKCTIKCTISIMSETLLFRERRNGLTLQSEIQFV